MIYIQAQERVLARCNAQHIWNKSKSNALLPWVTRDYEEVRTGY